MMSPILRVSHAKVGIHVAAALFDGDSAHFLTHRLNNKVRHSFLNTTVGVTEISCVFSHQYCRWCEVQATGGNDCVGQKELSAIRACALTSLLPRYSQPHSAQACRVIQHLLCHLHNYQIGAAEFCLKQRLKL